MAILYYYVSSGNFLDEYYYCLVPVEDYIPFAFVSILGFYVGLIYFDTEYNQWQVYFKKTSEIIHKSNLVFMMFFGLVGNFILQLNISFLNYLGVILYSFFKCSLICFILIGGKESRIYIIIGVVFSIIQLATGMIGGSLAFIVLVCIILFVKRRINKKRTYILILSFFAFQFLIFVAFLQNNKSDYRESIWVRGEESSINTFLKVASKNKEKNNFSIFNLEYYLNLIIRLNQGTLVSEVMKKVPSTVDFENGKTIKNAIVDALVPRYFNPDKEIVGGSGKMKKYAIRPVKEGTSMNVGLLGESYLNFGKLGAIFFMLLYGLFVGYISDRNVRVSKKSPLVLVFFPMYFEIFNGSESDFLLCFNSITKITLIIFVFLIFASKNKSQIHLENRV